MTINLDSVPWFSRVSPSTTAEQPKLSNALVRCRPCAQPAQPLVLYVHLRHSVVWYDCGESGVAKMYTLRLTVRDDRLSPFKYVLLSATNNDEAIKVGREQIAEQMPSGYTFVRARVCRGEEVIWSSKNATSSSKLERAGPGMGAQDDRIVPHPRHATGGA
jgi:hypothetical protein